MLGIAKRMVRFNTRRKNGRGGVLFWPQQYCINPNVAIPLGGIPVVASPCRGPIWHVRDALTIGRPTRRGNANEENMIEKYGGVADRPGELLGLVLGAPFSLSFCFAPAYI